jgi:hypothetical protein
MWYATQNRPRESSSRLTATINQPLHLLAQAIAQEHRLSLSHLVREALYLYLPTIEPRFAERLAELVAKQFKSPEEGEESK